MQNKNLLKKIQSSESTISMILGIVVVVAVGVLLVRYFQGVSFKENIPEILTGTSVKSENENNVPTGSLSKEKTTDKATTSSGKYIVQAGDSLWKISVKFYGTGFSWAKISQANNIKNPGLIEVGQELTIPSLSLAQNIGEPITGSKYTIVKGDNLWNISVRAYQDGFKWQEIAKANNLVNPRIIHPGNVLTIPR